MHLLLATFAVLIALLVLLVAFGPTRPDRSGRGIAFLAFFLAPLLVTGGGTRLHLEESKSTEFCLSCHVMTPYGRSLTIEESEYLPAVHYQNHLVPPERACYTCHTTYTMFGDIKAKLRGLNHLYVQYVTGPPEKLELYGPFNNRECLHCHEGARRFLEQEGHEGEFEALRSNETSCLECHEWSHAVDRLEELETWEGGRAKAGPSGPTRSLRTSETRRYRPAGDVEGS